MDDSSNKTLVKKKVSICIPVYNNPAGLKKLLDSILVQNYKDYEVIVSDDTSDLSCKDVALSFKDVLNLKYIEHHATGMPGDNWNSALEAASGEYIKMMFHDDWFTDESSLATFVSLLDNSDAFFAFSGTVQVSEDWRYARHIKNQDAELIKKDIRNLYLGNTIGAPSATIFRNKGARFDNKLRWLIDMEFYLRTMTGEPHTFTYTDEPLISIGISPDQLTNYCRQHPGIVRREYLYVARHQKLSRDPVYRKYLCSQIRRPH